MPQKSSPPTHPPTHPPVPLHPHPPIHKRRMPHVTRALLRKRAEHNDGLLTTLEELTLHQEELEGINDVLGQTCRELRILYLQNNALPIQTCFISFIIP